MMLSMRAFDLTGFNFVSEIEVRFSWKDSRLKLHHLNEDSSLNIIHLSDGEPWMPDVEFVGDALTTSDVEERHLSLMAQRMTDPLPDNNKNLGEGKSILGKIATVITSHVCLYVGVVVVILLFISSI